MNMPDSMTSPGESDDSKDSLIRQLHVATPESLGFLVWLGRLAHREIAGSRQLDNTTDVTFPFHVGHFRLDALLGTGAYGAVFRALDRKLERIVALKIAWPLILMDGPTSRRFVDEAKIVAALKHPGIVEVYDAGNLDVVHYISFELVEGPTLSRWMSEQDQIPIPKAVEFAHAIANAVAFAHKEGIIHRDLKPSNVLLRPKSDVQGDLFAPVVTDFGLARRPRLSDISISEATKTAAVIGTDRYMSPEQAAGQNHVLSPASDVFSLGVILYELLAGRRPFDSDSSDEIRRQIREEEPDSLRRWRRSIASDLETITSKCLQKSPLNRYADAAELAEDLRRFLANEPILAKPTTRLNKFGKLIRRRPRRVAAVVLGVLGLVFVSGIIGAMVSARAAAERELRLEKQRAMAADVEDRQRRYATGIRRAADAWLRTDMPEMKKALEICRDLAHGAVHRGLEWDFLNSRYNPANVVVETAPFLRTCVRFLPGDKNVVSGSSDGKLRIWNAADGSLIRTIDESVGSLTDLEISPDHKLLAIAGSTGQIHLRAIPSLDSLQTIPVFESEIKCIEWLGDSNRIGASGLDGALAVVDVRDGSTHTGIVKHKVRRSDPELINLTFRHLAYSPEKDAMLLGGGFQGTLVVDSHTLEQVGLLAPATHSYSGIAAIDMTPEHVVVLTENQNLQYVRSNSGITISQYSLQMIPNVPVYQKTSRTLYFAGEEGRIESWNVLRHGTMRLNSRCMVASLRSILSMDVSDTGDRVAMGSTSGKIAFLDAGYLRDAFDATVEIRLWSVEFSSCGRWMAILTSDREGCARVSIYNLMTGILQWEKKGEKVAPMKDDEIWPMTLHRLRNDYDDRLAIPNSRFPKLLVQPYAAFSPSGNEVVIRLAEETLCAIDSATGNELRTYPMARDFGMEQLIYSPDGKEVVVINSQNNKFAFDRLLTQQIKTTVHDPNRWLGDFHVDGKFVTLLANADGIEIQDYYSGKPQSSLTGASERIRIASISPDGATIAGTGLGIQIYQWNISQPTSPEVLSGHRETIAELRFSPDGQTLLSRSGDGNVRFWHIPTHSELFSLGSKDEAVFCMAIHPTGGLLVFGEIRVGDNDFGWRYGLRFHRIGTQPLRLPEQFRNGGKF